MKKMMDELQEEKDEMIQKRDIMKEEYDSMPMDDQMKPHVLSKIRKID